MPAATYSEESGIECSPAACTKACGACLALLLSLTAVASLGVIAGGAFWHAQSVYRLTDNKHLVHVNHCCYPASTHPVCALGLTGMPTCTD